MLPLFINAKYKNPLLRQGIFMFLRLFEKLFVTLHKNNHLVLCNSLILVF